MIHYGSLEYGPPLLSNIRLVQAWLEMTKTTAYIAKACVLNLALAVKRRTEIIV
jgi:hypothetical protein